MIIKNPLHINFDELESDAEFRAHYLFFLQLANTYIVSIFWHCFNDGKRKKVLYQTLEKLKKQKQIEFQKKKIQKSELVEKKFAEAIFAKRKDFDAFCKSFEDLLRALPQTRQDAFKNKLTEHAIPIDFNKFLDLLDEMRLKRHHLKSWKQKANKRFTESKIIEALGFFLLSKHYQHFIGAIEHAQKRLQKNNPKFTIDLYPITKSFSQARKDRNEASLLYYGKRRKKSELSRSERKNRENSITAVQKKYNDYYPENCWPRYNFHQFKIRHYFFGKKNIATIKKLLNCSTPHFQRDIEAIYETSTHINRILHLAIFYLDDADKTLSKAEKKRRMGAIQGRMREIRNAIAHNTHFYNIKAKKQPRDENSEIILLTPEQVFTTVFLAFHKPHVIKHLGSAKQQINNIYTKLIGVFNKQKYHWVFPINNSNDEIDHTPPKIIKYWSKENREEYANRNKWQLDKREYVKEIISDWVKQLNMAQKKSKKPN